ncbi:isoleucine--tRNA ligase, partial [bacterium]|nr:isoleucine--tRNA ligase [bacterium]
RAPFHAHGPEADLYLEGHDQHRGWFHSSLLIGIAARGRAPYDAILTHGFLVDEKGRKMSKSEGNVIAPESVIKEYGADILRWWVASSDFKNDVSVAKSILNQNRDTFSKVRNTIRFCLSNLYDFEPKTDLLDVDQLAEIDRWALTELADIIDTCKAAYDTYDFHIITHRIHDYCAVNLSALYLDMVKDRLYCDAPDSRRRRSTQIAIYHIVNTLIHLIAPILVFTAEDAYRYFNAEEKSESIHLGQFPSVPDGWRDSALTERWKGVIAIKDLAYQQLEPLRKDKVIKSFLEAEVDITAPQPAPISDLESVLIVSRVNWTIGDALSVQVRTAEGAKCDRCWKILPVDDAGLCGRCAEVVKAVTATE